MSAAAALEVENVVPILSTYVDLDRAIDAADADQAEAFRRAMFARWEFGKRLLAEREANGGKQLPHGRLDELAAELGRSRKELDLRMRLAEVHDSGEKVCNALQTYGSWREVIKGFPPKRTQESEPEESPEEAESRDADHRAGREAMLLNVLLEAFHESNLKDMSGKARNELAGILERAIKTLKEMDE